MSAFLKTSFVLFLAVLSLPLVGQKFGYLNSAQILAEMPEVAQMNSNLEGYKTVLQKKGQQMVEEFQLKQQDAVTRKERGELSPVAEQQIMTELQNKQNEILAYEQSMQQDLAKKESELLQPILERVNEAIQLVAKENGFTYIFDVSAGVLLYADETLDVTPLVKTKLAEMPVAPPTSQE